MNNIGNIQDILCNFLESPKPGVLAIKGEWGVGKTYFWKDFLGRIKPDLKGAAYSYVSLFGVGSLRELQRLIFAKQEVLGDSWTRQKTWMKNRLPGAMKYVDVGWKGIGSLRNTEIWSEMIQDRLLKNFVVCIDDLERKEPSLTASSLLGFITNLRDDRGCKVILLYNESEATKEPKLRTALAEYREKVFDRELTFDPTVEDCYTIVFGAKTDRYRLSEPNDFDGNPLFDGDTRSVLELFQELEIANIRVIRKTKDALDYFEPKMSGRFPNLWPTFARQLVKLSCLHYVYGEVFPLDTLIKTSQMGDYYLGKSDKPEDQELFRKREPIRAIGYSATDTDVVILDFLSCGSVDWDKHDKLLAEKERQFHLTGLNAQHRAVWSKLWDNFTASQEEFVEAQIQFLVKNQAELSLSAVDQAVQIVLSFGPNPQVEAILEKKMEEFAAAGIHESRFDAFHGLTVPTASKVRELLAQKVESKPILEALTMMTRQGGWTSMDINYLSNTTEGDFYQWLKTEKASGIPGMIKEFRSRFGGRPESGAVVERLDNALRRLATRSKIDDIRVYSNIGLKRTKDAIS
jgi:hypothetical protein